MASDISISSQEIASPQGQSHDQLAIFTHSLFFVLGFSLVFILGWGGAATLLGKLFSVYKDLLGKVGGVVVILFGMATLGVVRIPWLYYDTRPVWTGRRKQGFLASALMGVFFAAGWTPCVGTVLGAILTLGFSQQTSGQAILLSSGYAIGLGVPFLLIGAGMHRAAHFVRRFRPYLHKVQVASGVFLILIGGLILTNQTTRIAIWAQRNGFFLDVPLGAAITPTYLIALAAGLISFFSPCVLPLVPAYLGYLSSHAYGESEMRRQSTLDQPT